MSFYLLDQLSLGKSSRQRRNNVNMIGKTAYMHEVGTKVVADCGQITMHAWPHV
jgi:hypothetical protein